MSFSNLHRDRYIQSLSSETFDVLIIGGGITGAGIALDATLRGMKTALVEMQDFAAGTSSRSTKLIHGGLRYLKQGEIKLVAEVGKEREIVYENGPHVTTPEWMLLPIYKGGTFGRFTTSIGLRLYDFLAGVKRNERRSMLSANETLAKEALLKANGLKGAGYYVEYRTDDARLTIEVLKAAVQKDAVCLNYAKVEQLLYDDSEIIQGVVVVDQVSGEPFRIHAKKVINATGPWVDTIRERDHSREGKKLRLTKGVHVVIDQSCLPLQQAIYFDTPDKRMVFAIPRDGKTYIGTTDTFYSQDPEEPKVSKEDRLYLISAIHYMFPTIKITEDNIESSWAGIRPLIWEEGKDPSEISRKDEIWESESGLITIAGGKLTGYRKMAELVVDVLVKKMGKEENRHFLNCQTKGYPISGGEVGGSKDFKRFINKEMCKGIQLGLSSRDAEYLTRKYGSNISDLYQLLETEQWGNRTKNLLPDYLWLELQYALEHEMVVTPIDFLSRRTGALLFDINVVKKYREEVISSMGEYFHWTLEEKKRYTSQVDRALEIATIPFEQ